MSSPPTSLRSRGVPNPARGMGRSVMNSRMRSRTRETAPACGHFPKISSPPQTCPASLALAGPSCGSIPRDPCCPANARCPSPQFRARSMNWIIGPTVHSVKGSRRPIARATAPCRAIPPTPQPVRAERSHMVSGRTARVTRVNRLARCTIAPVRDIGCPQGPPGTRNINWWMDTHSSSCHSEAAQRRGIPTRTRRI
jgi:hypothetical protein